MTTATLPRQRKAVLRAADARRAGRAAMETGCAVEVVTPNGLRFRFTPPGAEETDKPKANSWDDAEA
jgi:hypothetical protein